MPATPPSGSASKPPALRPNRDSGISLPASPTSLGPATPAPTTSDIHNNNNEIQQNGTPDSRPKPSRSRSGMLSRSPVMTRFMTVDPADSPQRLEAIRAIKEGRVVLGEDMLERRRREMEAEDEDEGLGGEGEGQEKE